MEVFHSCTTIKNYKPLCQFWSACIQG
jgi:hypothetical protein